MTGHGAKFSRKMEAAVVALLTHRNHEEAARAGKHRDGRTLLRWQKEARVPEDLPCRPPGRPGQSIARLQQASSAAVSTLLKVMVDANTPGLHQSPGAADSVLNHSAKAMELEDIEARVEELERAVRSIQTNSNGPMRRTLGKPACKTRTLQALELQPKKRAVSDWLQGRIRGARVWFDAAGRW